MLRQEIYADDAGPAAPAFERARAATPYTVTEQNFSIRIVQPRGANKHAVFCTHASEAVNYQYERNAADPRIQHTLTLEVDDFAKVLKQAAVGYGRRAQIRVVDSQGQVQQIPNPGFTGLQSADQAQQTTALLTYTETLTTNAIEVVDAHRAPLTCEATTFELSGYTPTGPGGRFQPTDFVEPDTNTAGRLRHKFAAPEVAYEATAAGSQRRRPVQRVRTLFRRDDLSSLLPLGELQSLALPGESYQLAFTPGLLAQVFQRPRAAQAAEALLPDPTAVLGGRAGDRGGYVQSQALKADGRFPATDADDHWWIPSGQAFFSAGAADNAITELTQAQHHFFLPRRHRSPFSQDTFVDFDAHDLLMIETRDALNNRISVEANDYRVLQPRLVSDPNGNRTEVAFDILGFVTGTALVGKSAPAPVEGDSLAGFAADITQNQLDQFMAAPRQASPNPTESEATQIAHDLLQNATARILYDLDRFTRIGEPPLAVTISRETHVAELPAGTRRSCRSAFRIPMVSAVRSRKRSKRNPGRWM